MMSLLDEADWDDAVRTFWQLPEPRAFVEAELLEILQIPQPLGQSKALASGQQPFRIEMMVHMRNDGIR